MFDIIKEFSGYKIYENKKKESLLILDKTCKLKRNWVIKNCLIIIRFIRKIKSVKWQKKKILKIWRIKLRNWWY